MYSRGYMEVGKGGFWTYGTYGRYRINEEWSQPQFLLRAIQARINNIKNKLLVANKYIDKQFRLIFWLYARNLFS